MTLRILLIEPYCGGSHRAWVKGYAAHSRHQIELLALPARFWKWRMEGGAATLAARARRRGSRPDLLLATGMLDLPAFLGFTRDLWPTVPSAVYFHENQLTYPCPPGEKRNLTYGLINWLSMLAADRVFFDSQYHFDNWFEELPRLLKHFPDYTHTAWIPAVRHKATVLPVGCELGGWQVARSDGISGDVPVILWNQRWEYDKDPQTFMRAVDVLIAEGVDFRVALAGSNVRQKPEEFESARARWGERVIHYGRATRSQYRRLLCQADIVVSTAIHEFFGIAVVEAIYGGCFPVLPRRLSYPELLPVEHHAACFYDDFDGLVKRLKWAMANRDAARQIAKALRPAMARFDWQVQAPQYDDVMEGIVENHR
ncbi:MAG: DUF3524 domain-containing protein [Anaerolineae bacterium]|nr:DUF3524 domain-containing protein [Anaerolineae bacterium]